MKKFLSFLMAIVLLVSAIPTGAFNLSASAACSRHTYTNACDTICNECGSERVFVAHDYVDCFSGREDNITYLGEWHKTATKTGVFGIKPVEDSKNFTYHYLVVADQNGCEVKFNENIKGWPMVGGQEYTIRLLCQYDGIPVSDIDFNLVEITEVVFSDVTAYDWYNDSVTYNVGVGFVSGYGGTTKFGPADNIQRQDFAVILARLAGVDLNSYVSSGNYSFADVPSGAYYEKAILWAADCGITTGYAGGTVFGVGDVITREQLVTFLYRYAEHANGGAAPTVSGDAKQKATAYADYNDVTDYAKEPIIWALDKGVIKGQGGTHIAPGGNALRCETAEILYNNYLNKIVPTVKLCLHTYQDATCTAPKTCGKCRKTIGFPVAHSYNDATCLAPRTCKNCGSTIGSLGDHDYKDATCMEPQTCILCGDVHGEALAHNYVAGECINVNNGEICNHFKEDYCPKLFFTGDMSKITDPSQTSKKIECDINFEYRSADQVLNGAAKIKIQGSSSTKYAKKNYTINFYEDSNYSNKKKIDVGWGKQSKYCLKANWIDKTHSRNIVSARIASQVQAKYGLFTAAPHNGTIDGFPVEVYINGEFHGLYTMNIPKDEWMFGMDKNNPNHIVICGENWNDPVLFKSVPTDLEDWTVEAGPEDDATLQKVQRLVDFVLNSSDEEFKRDFEQYLNLDSTLNYFVMMSYFWASDNTGKNMLLATYDGNVWYPTMYDLDTTWGTHWDGTKTSDYSKGFVNGSNSVLWKRFSTLYSKEIAERYFELREDILDPDNIMEEFNDFYSCIPQEVLDRETQKWNTVDNPIPGYDFTQIQHYLNTVVPRLDAIYESWR